MAKPWKQVIEERLVPDLHRLTLVIDGDDLLSDERIIHNLQAKGFSVMEVIDSIQLRYEYELIRKKWDFEGSKINLLLICNPMNFDERDIPYDIWSKANRVEVSLEILFPLLHQPSIRNIDKQHYDQLLEDIEDEGLGAPLNEGATNFFLLRSLFRIEGNRIKTDNDIFLMLLKTHYHRRVIPSFLTFFLESYLKRKNRASGWQISSLLNSPELFWDYVQTIWESTLQGLTRYSNLGPSLLPFADRDVAVYLDNVFNEGLLQPIRIEGKLPNVNLPESLVYAGTTVASKEELATERLEQLSSNLIEALPTEGALFSEWLEFQKLYAQAVRLSTLYCKDQKTKNTVSEIRQTSNVAFFEWMNKHFDSLLFQKGRTPVLVSQIHSYLVKTIMAIPRIALVVIDGLSYDQWLTIKEILEEELPSVLFEENGCFAWVPSLTSISRQAIFSGKPPRSFAKSVETTTQEEKHWLSAWNREIIGLRKEEVLYMKNLGLKSAEQDLYSISDSVKYLGLVVNSIDNIIHGMTLGNLGMHESIATWMNNKYLATLIKGLLEKKFEVFLVSDHGNIEAMGTGLIQEGKIVETKGERVRSYSTKVLRDAMVGKHEKEAIPWDSSTLPEEYHVALSASMGAFTTVGKKTVSHGGLSLEEVIVPFVRIVRK